LVHTAGAVGVERRAIAITEALTREHGFGQNKLIVETGGAGGEGGRMLKDRRNRAAGSGLGAAEPTRHQILGASEQNR